MKDILINEARLKLIQATSVKKIEEDAQAPQQKKVVAKGQDFLLKAIETAENCQSLIPKEEERIISAVKQIEKNKDKDKWWMTRTQYLLDNLDVMKRTYPLFAEEAKRRRALYQSIDRKNQWANEKAKCAEDTHYWFDNYAWTADPRKSGLWSLPFMLYDFQRDTVDWLESLIFTRQENGIIEKSRDLGLSWLISALFYKHWQHPQDGSFQALVGSITASECDTIGDPSSLFEKLRIQSRLQPTGLLPKGWDGNIPYMKAINPENGSTITGENASGDFGRSGRYKVILFDEFSAFEQDTQALTASSQSSPCRIFNSTARGTGNEFYRLRGTGSIEVKTLHWTLHPFKSQNWYDYQKLTMNPVMVAQELDIDYNASQPNKVYPDYNEVYNVVSQSEVMRALPSFRDAQGRFRIPLGHKVMMGEDVGQTEDHAHVLLWFVTLKEGTVTTDGIDLSGCVLLYREIVLPPHTTPRKGAGIIKEAESQNYESMLVYDRLISQEALTERDIYEEEYGLGFRHWKPDYNTGIARVRDYLEIINHHQPHPFREATRADKFPKGLPIMGRPSLFIVSEDSQAELQYNQTLQNYIVHIPEDNKGLIRTRFEFPAYHYSASELGKELKKMRPKKAFDDCFIEGTRILTNKGEIPIEKIKKGDLVLTRDGYKPVKDCCMTHSISDIYEIEFTNGEILRGTKNHPIWNGVDFVPMDVLRCGDEVESSSKWNQLYLTELLTEDTQILNTNLIENISSVEYTTKETGSAIFTGIYGYIIMEQYLKSIISIIKTIILITTTYLILNVLVLKNTTKFIQNQKYHQKENHILIGLGVLLLNGINQMLEEDGILKWLEKESLFLNTMYVSFVTKSLKAKNKEELNFAPVLVKKKATDTGLRLPVWNLEVEETHEYFANGILVHNCMDVVRCVATECFAPISPLTEEEKYEKGLPDNLKRDNIHLLPLQEQGMAFIQRQEEKRQYNEQFALSQLTYRERLFRKSTNGKPS